MCWWHDDNPYEHERSDVPCSSGRAVVWTEDGRGACGAHSIELTRHAAQLAQRVAA